LAVYPFIFLKNKSLYNNWVLINHERIHLRQQKELLWIFFFLWYTLEFVYHLIRLRNWNKAYRSISFEKEAYENEGNPNYIKNRRNWSFIHYFI